MKNKSKFLTESVITIIVAGFLSSAITLLLVFIGLNLGMGDQSVMAVNAFGGVLFGAAFGYKMNTLIRQYKS